MEWLAIGTAAAVTITGLIYMVICAVVAHKMTRAKRMDPLRNPIWNQHHGDRVSFASRDAHIALSGWYLPVQNATRVVLFVHGKDCCRGEELNTSTYELVQSLRKQGFSILMMDLRGHGHSDTARMTYGLREKRDVLGALDWLLGLGYQPANIGIFGASMGGACALGALATARGEALHIGALVTDSTYADFADMMRLKFRKFSGMPQFFLPGALWLGRMTLREDLSKISPESHAAQIAGLPMLVIHAEGDPFVPVAHARRLADSGKASVWITRNPRHMDSFHVDPTQYVERVSGFFMQHLGAMPMMRKVA